VAGANLRAGLLVYLNNVDWFVIKNRYNDGGQHMEITPTQSLRISGLLFNIDSEGEAAILLHLARAKHRPNTDRSKNASSLPPDPRSWMPATAKSYRCSDDFMGLRGYFEQRYRQSSSLLTNHGRIFPEVKERNNRRHWWLLVEVKKRKKVKKDPIRFESYQWATAKTIGSLRQDMSEDWYHLLLEALEGAIKQQPSLRPIFQALVAAY
jgi:hypothetical protein